MHKYLNHEITNIEAAKLIGVSRGTFFLCNLINDKSHNYYALFCIAMGLYIKSIFYSILVLCLLNAILDNIAITNKENKNINP